MWRMLIHSLKGIQHLNKEGLTHGDINPMNILITLNDPASNTEHTLFRVKLIEFLKINELGEIALTKVRIACIKLLLERGRY